VTFTSLATDPENRIQVLEWDLDGDSQYDDAFGPTAQKTFDTPGTKTVRLKVTDSEGGSHTAAKTITIPSQPPVASFVYSPATPLSLQAVTFTSTSSDPDGSITQIRWDTDGDNNFNDDGSDIEVEHTFTTAGTKTVRLRVTDDDNNTVTVSQVLQIGNRPPRAVIDGPTAALKNTNVTFKSDASADPSRDLDGTIEKREWDTDGDGYDDGTGTQVTKSFAATGPKTIRLRVTDNSGVTDEDVHVIEIGGNASPVAAFTVSPASPMSFTNTTFSSTSTDSDGTIVKTEWDFDNDGLFETSGKTVTRQFTVPGSAPVTMRVTDEDGASQTLLRTVNVLNQGPTASIGLDTTSPVSLLPIVFSASAPGTADKDGTIVSRQWDFDNDGAFDDGIGESVPWTFPRKGTYTVKVKVTDNSFASAIASRAVVVANTLPRATFTFGPDAPNPRELVTLTSTSVDPDDPTRPPAVEWDLDNDGAFDDGTGTKVTKAFPTSGNQTVRLRATDIDGGEAIGSQTIVIGNRPPTASFDFRPAAPVAGQLVTLFSTSDDPDKNIERVDWDLDGDGAYDASGASASRTFPAGSFNVSMRVTDTSDSFAIVTNTIVVGVPPAAPKTDSRLRALSPFPIVRMAGRIGKRGTNFRLLTVDAPSGSTVTVRCRGRGCPFSKTTRAAKVAKKLRIRKLENRLLRAGTTIRIFVTKAGTIGKYTSISIRGGKPPKRVDRCLMPGSMKPSQCQS
jgi:PKD repeat protein